jgi:hypothetical protein
MPHLGQTAVMLTSGEKIGEGKAESAVLCKRDRRDDRGAPGRGRPAAAATLETTAAGRMRRRDGVSSASSCRHLFAVPVGQAADTGGGVTVGGEGDDRDLGQLHFLDRPLR